jgi:DNA gyrase/topoisomerase IV subunit B
MYIEMWGSRTHHLVYEVVDNSIDEMGGYCDTIVDINGWFYLLLKIMVVVFR